MFINKKKCMVSVNGVVADLQSRCLDFPMVITVKYEVESQIYEIKETVKMKSSVVKIGFLPIGQKKVPVMTDVSVGTITEVLYNPDNPKEAYIKENVGIIVL